MFRSFTLIFLILTTVVSAQETRRKRVLPHEQRNQNLNFSPASGMAASVTPGIAAVNGTFPLPQFPGKVAVYMRARTGGQGQVIAKGLQWRVFLSAANDDNTYTIIGESREPAPIFALDSGQYIVHVAFGLTTQVRKIDVVPQPDGQREMFNLNSGGLTLKATLAEKRINADLVTYDIYGGSQFESKEPQLLMKAAKTDQLIMLPEGSYHIVSTYGDANATVRADVKVTANKITEATLHHRAGDAQLRLIDERNQPITNATWTIMNPSGDVIKESSGAFPPLALLEGDYQAMARVDGKVFSQKFVVETGQKINVDIIAK